MSFTEKKKENMIKEILEVISRHTGEDISRVIGCNEIFKIKTGKNQIDSTIDVVIGVVNNS